MSSDDLIDVRDDARADRPRLSPTWIPPSERLLSSAPPSDSGTSRRVIDEDQMRREGFALLSELAGLD